MFSLIDEVGNTLHTGRNSKTKTEAIEAGVGLLYGSMSMLDEPELTEQEAMGLSLQEQEEMLQDCGISVVKE